MYTNIKNLPEGRELTLEEKEIKQEQEEFWRQIENAEYEDKQWSSTASKVSS